MSSMMSNPGPFPLQEEAVRGRPHVALPLGASPELDADEGPVVEHPLEVAGGHRRHLVAGQQRVPVARIEVLRSARTELHGQCPFLPDLVTDG